MKIIHRICIDPKQHRKAKRKFEKLGIRMTQGGEPRVVEWSYFDMPEDDPLWSNVEKTLWSAGIRLIPTWTTFTEEEILAAKWVGLGPGFIHGYPMPNLHDEYKETSYTSENECKDCGIGLCQKAPIHLKSEPKLGRNHFMGIFWTYDIFARNEVLEVLSQENITGFEAYPAMHYRKKTPLNTIKQLKILGELGPAIVNDNLTREDYSCGHVKYLGLSRGMYRFSRDAFKDMPDLVKSCEWFGSAHAAFQLVLASSKFVKLYIENNWRGLSLAPLELI